MIIAALFAAVVVISLLLGWVDATESVNRGDLAVIVIGLLLMIGLRDHVV